MDRPLITFLLPVQGGRQSDIEIAPAIGADQDPADMAVGSFGDKPAMKPLVIAAIRTNANFLIEGELLNLFFRHGLLLNVLSANFWKSLEVYAKNQSNLEKFGKIAMPPNKFVRAVFPGSFDPITNGHLDVIRRAVKIFDEVIIAVGDSGSKDYLFTGEERLEMIRELIREIPEARVERFTGLTVEYVKSVKADVILRGLRNLTDVQYEFQLAMTNRAVAGVETVFIMTSEQFGFTSSSIIREIGRYGGDVSSLVPPAIYQRLQSKFQKD